MSNSITQTKTDTLTHAKHLASKIATDLKRIQRFYGKPSDSDISSYETEAIALFKSGYLQKITYGFKKNNKWIEPTLVYTKSILNSGYEDDDPGRIKPGKPMDVSGASFGSYLEYSQTWYDLSSNDQQNFKNKLPFQRVSADYPDSEGFFSNDKNYSSGDLSISRQSLKGY